MHRLPVSALVVVIAGLGLTPAASAQNAINCAKPWAIPDRWVENQTPTWDPTDTFNRYETQGQSAGSLVSSPDVFVPVSFADPGSGFRLFDQFSNAADYGLQLTIKPRDNAQSPSGGWFNVVDLGGAGGGGGAYRAAISGCVTTPVSIGDVLQIVNGNHHGPTVQGVLDLIATDPTAVWDPTAQGGTGGIVGSAFTTISPRVVPVIFYDPDLFQASLAAGQAQVTVHNLFGMFIEGLENKAVIGRLVTVPGVIDGGN